jgi:hypothetical protein
MRDPQQKAPPPGIGRRTAYARPHVERQESANGSAVSVSIRMRENEAGFLQAAQESTLKYSIF